MRRNTAFIVAIVLLLILIGGILIASKRVPNYVANINLNQPSSMPTTTLEPSPSEVPSTTPIPTGSTQGKTQIQLSELHNSGQSGTATLSEENGKVVVKLQLSGGNFTEPQPAHIHIGSCPNPGTVLYPLSTVVNGTSTTTLNVSIDQLLAKGDALAINVHKSAAEIQNYTACGNLK